MMNSKIPLSVVIIALNEQDNLPRLLQSVNWAGEVLVYDSGSTDETVAIAKKMGAKVIEGPWLGFGKTKRVAAEAARFDWVLSVDCDEEVSAELKGEIAEKFPRLDEKTVYRLPRLSLYLGRWIRHGGWYPDYQGRLFNKKYSNWDEAPIHEKVQGESLQIFKCGLQHYVFRDIAHQVTTNNRYSGLQAAEMHKAGKKFSWFHFLTKPGVKFLECYILKLGFLDAAPGYIIARNAAHSVFMKWAKLREIERAQ